MLDEVFERRFLALEENRRSQTHSRNVASQDEATLTRPVSQISNARCDAAADEVRGKAGRIECSSDDSATGTVRH